MHLFAKIGIGAGAIFILSKILQAVTASSLTFDIDSVDLSQFGLRTVLPVTLMVTNPTTGSLTLSGLTANAFVNGDYIGTASEIPAITIAPAAKTPVQVNVSLALAQVVSDVVSILNGSAGIPASIFLQGSVVVNTITFPINLTLKIL